MNAHDGSFGKSLVQDGSGTLDAAARAIRIPAITCVRPDVEGLAEEGFDQVAVKLEAAIEELVNSHHDLVKRIATGYEGRNKSRGELIDIGVAAMTFAAPKFEPEQGVLFSTYASWWIKQAMKDALLSAARPKAVELVG